MKKSELKELIKAEMMAEVQNKVSEQTGQFKKGDKVNYDGEKHLIVNILNDGSPILVPMSEIDNEAFSVDSNEVDNAKLHSKVKYDGEKHLVVNILKDGSPVLVPMSVIDDEAFSIDSDEIEESKTMTEVQYDIDDTNSDYDFLTEKYVETPYEKLLSPAVISMIALRNYVETASPEYLDDIKSAIEALMKFDDKMTYGDDEEYSDDDLGVPGDNALGLEEAEEEVDAEEVDVKVGDEEIETTDVKMTDKVDPNVKAVQDALTAAQAAASDLGDEKLTDQIGNTITFFTRQHVANIDSMNEMDVQAAADDTTTNINSVAAAEIGMEENLNEDLTSTITIILAFLIGIPGVPIAGALMMGLIDYIFNGLPDQYNEYRSLKLYKGPDKQEKVLALAKEIESKLSPGKKRYLKALVNRIGVSKLEDKARAYRELDRYASGEKSQMDRGLDENLNTDIEAALKDLPIPMDIEDNKKSSMNESRNRMLKLAGIIK